MENQENIFSVFQKNHLRLTKTRKALVSVFLGTTAPLSVPDILGELHRLRVAVNKTTVYREISRMQIFEIIRSIQLGDRKQYYELASREHHHHLVCLRCEQVEDVDMNESVLFAEERRVRREKNFIISRHSLEFFGLCKMCS